MAATRWINLNASFTVAQLDKVRLDGGLLQN